MEDFNQDPFKTGSLYDRTIGDLRQGSLEKVKSRATVL